MMRSLEEKAIDSISCRGSFSTSRMRECDQWERKKEEAEKKKKEKASKKRKEKSEVDDDDDNDDENDLN